MSDVAYQTEHRNFFNALRGLNRAVRNGEDPEDFVTELEAIAMHSETPSLKVRAQKAIDDYRQPATAAG